MSDLVNDIAFEHLVKTRRKSVTSKPATTVVGNGSNVSNVLGIPAMMEPFSSAAILNNLVCREILDPSGPLEPISPTVIGLQLTVKAITEGADIEPYRESIQRVTANQPEKGDIIRSYLNQIDHEILADMAVMRANAIRVVKRSTGRHDVSVNEALVIWRMCNEQMPSLQKSLAENKPVDSFTVVEKIDLNKQQIERTVQKRWEGTTPQGRELIRKKLWEIKRTMLDEAGIHPPGIEVQTVAEPATT